MSCGQKVSVILNSFCKKKIKKALTTTFSEPTVNVSLEILFLIDGINKH